MVGSFMFECTDMKVHANVLGREPQGGHTRRSALRSVDLPSPPPPPPPHPMPMKLSSTACVTVQGAELFFYFDCHSSLQMTGER